MLFVLSTILIATTLFPVVAVLNPQKVTSRILTFYLLGFGVLVLNAEISGFAALLDRQWVFLLLQGVESMVAWTVWWRGGKPKLSSVLHFNSPSLIGSDVWNSIRKNPLAAVLTLLVSAGYGVLAWLIIRLPPNNSDSMHTHLARIMYWLQQGSFKQLTSHSIYAKIYPFNAQLNVLWTILFTHSDKFVGFVQFFAAIATAVAIYGLGRLLNSPKKYALLASLIWLMLPLIVFQATSTQFDLVVTALFTCSIYFFFDYYQNKIKASLFYSGLAMGLALGTKETVFMMGPAVLVVAIILLIKDKHNLTWLWKWAAGTLIAFLILGSYPFFNNLHYYGNPFGPSEHVESDSLGNYTFIQKLRYNTPRFIYQYISFDSLPLNLANSANDLKNLIFKSVDRTLNLGMESPIGVKTPTLGFSLDAKPRFNEDESWFGFVGTLLFVPALIAGIINGLKKKNLISISLALFAFSFYFCEILLRPGWDRYQSRYFILAVAAIMPLSVFLFSDKLPSRVFQVCITILSLVIFFMAVVSNESKVLLSSEFFEAKYAKMEKTYIPQGPLEGYYRKYMLKFYSFMNFNLPFRNSINDFDDTQLRVFSSRNLHEEILNAYNALVPENATVGINLVSGDFDYIFFGAKLTHRLINIEPLDLIYDLKWIQQEGITYVLIADYQRIQTYPPYLHLLAEVDYWRLYSVNP